MKETGKTAISYLSGLFSTIKLLSRLPGTTANMLGADINNVRMSIFINEIFCGWGSRVATFVGRGLRCNSMRQGLPRVNVEFVVIWKSSILAHNKVGGLYWRCAHHFGALVQSTFGAIFYFEL